MEQSATNCQLSHLCLCFNKKYLNVDFSGFVYYFCVVRGWMSVLLLSDLFVQLDFNSFVVCYVKVFEQMKMDGWMEVKMCKMCVMLGVQYSPMIIKCNPDQRCGLYLNRRTVRIRVTWTSRYRASVHRPRRLNPNRRYSARHNLMIKTRRTWHQPPLLPTRTNRWRYSSDSLQVCNELEHVIPKHELISHLYTNLQVSFGCVSVLRLAGV